VFEWHRVAICCAVAGEVSLHRVPRDRIASKGAYRRLPVEPPAAVYAHRRVFPHLAGREITVDCRRRLGMRHFRSDLPTDFGLRTALGRVPDRPAGGGSSS
jgi:hypothetical protein